MVFEKLVMKKFEDGLENFLKLVLKKVLKLVSKKVWRWQWEFLKDGLDIFFQDGLEDCAGLEDGPYQNLKDSLDDDGKVR